MRIPVLLIGLALGSGCSKKVDDGAPPVHVVTGRVTYDGKAAAGVLVTFLPTDAPGIPRIPRNPHGVTQSDGTFTLGTFSEGDGAAEGGYQVVLSWPPDKPEDTEAGIDADRLFGWYDATHSTLSVRVKEGTNSIPVFNLPKVSGPPPPSQGVPGRN